MTTSLFLQCPQVISMFLLLVVFFKVLILLQTFVMTVIVQRKDKALATSSYFAWTSWAWNLLCRSSVIVIVRQLALLF
jgi:hypothetical protein